MARFQDKKQPHTTRNLFLSAGIFLLIAVIFYGGVLSVSDDTVKRQRESLENAINRDISFCYAMEGRYPESLEKLTPSLLPARSSAQPELPPDIQK